MYVNLQQFRVWGCRVHRAPKTPSSPTDTPQAMWLVATENCGRQDLISNPPRHHHTIFCFTVHTVVIFTMHARLVDSDCSLTSIWRKSLIHDRIIFLKQLFAFYPSLYNNCISRVASADSNRSRVNLGGRSGVGGRRYNHKNIMDTFSGQTAAA
jgi:hypothetical protein